MTHDFVQVLRFMRTDAQVYGQPVLLSDEPPYQLQHTVSSIRTSIQSGGYGQVNIVKDFLKDGDTSTTVTRGKTAGEGSVKSFS